MRASFIELNGRKYCLAMSNRVLVDMENKGKSLDEFLNEENKTVTNICWLLRRMSEAGRVYMAMQGDSSFEAIDENELLDASGSGDYDHYMDAILEAVTGERRVDAEPPKNAGAARLEAQES